MRQSATFAVLASALLPLIQAQTGNLEWEVSNLRVSLSPESPQEHRPSGPTTITITVKKGEDQSSTCKQSWNPPTYPRGWIGCNGDPTLFYRYWNATRSPLASFNMEIAEIVTRPSSQGLVTTLRNASFFTTNNSPSNPNAYLSCLSPPTGQAIDCYMDGMLSNGRHPVMYPSERQINISNSIQLSSIHLGGAEQWVVLPTSSNVLKNFLGGLNDTQALSTDKCSAMYTPPASNASIGVPIQAQCDNSSVTGLSMTVLPLADGLNISVSQSVSITPGALFGVPQISGNGSNVLAPMGFPPLILTINATTSLPYTNPGPGPKELDLLSIEFTARNSTA